MQPILVNKENLIPDDYINTINLVEVLDANGKKVKVEEKTYEAYMKLKEFLETKNIIVGITSAYRSLKDQEDVYHDFVNRYGEDYASKFVAPVGASEHHTGLAVDIDIKVDGAFLDSNVEMVRCEPIYLQIHKYLKDFGFILRFPKNKENITGYPYEAWHIRYVGKDIAEEIYDNDLTLEEYVEKHKK